MAEALHKVKEVREETGVSRNSLHKLTGISYKTLWKVENGGDLRIGTLRKIAKALHVDVRDLL
jgi:DNA-binding XRE family transcriptional regulator